MCLRVVWQYSKAEKRLNRVSGSLHQHSRSRYRTRDDSFTLFRGNLHDSERMLSRFRASRTGLLTRMAALVCVERAASVLRGRELASALMRRRSEAFSSPSDL